MDDNEQGGSDPVKPNPDFSRVSLASLVESVSQLASIQTDMLRILEEEYRDQNVLKSSTASDLVKSFTEARMNTKIRGQLGALKVRSQNVIRVILGQIGPANE